MKQTFVILCHSTDFLRPFSERFFMPTLTERRTVMLIIIVAAFFFIPFLGRVHLFDWDEINFAEAAREMVVTGNYLQVQINYQPFWEKPPLFMWLQSLSMHAFGVSDFAARFVDALCGVLTLLIVYRNGRKLFDRLFGFFWAFAFLGSFLPHFFFKSGIIDPVFNLFIFSGIYFFATAPAIQESKRRMLRFIMAGACIGLAVLTKGPVAFLLVSLCVLVVMLIARSLAGFRIRDIVVAVVATIIVAGAWYGVETLRHGTWFISKFIVYQIHLFTRGEAGHGRPFYFHFFVLLFGCFPASFLAIRAFFAIPQSTASQQNFTRWMKILFWVVLILFSIVKTKTVLYSSLTYFPITYLAALHVHAVCRKKLSWTRIHSIALGAFGMLVAAVIAVFPILMMHMSWITPLIHDKFAVACLQRPVAWYWYEAFIGIGYALLIAGSLVFIRRSQFKQAFAILFVSTALCIQFFMLDCVPKMETYIVKGPIDFYQSFQGKHCYVRALFKSYADLYYSRVMPGGHPQSYDKNWLLTGPIDRPAYFVCRSHKAKTYIGKNNVREIKTEYGFTYLMRDQVVQETEKQ